MPISKTAFDGAEAWAMLTPAEQASVGALALEAAAGSWIADTCDGDAAAERAGNWGASCAFRGIESLFVMDRIQVRDADGGWMMPSVIGPICRECGCSHDDPCEEGCGWAEEDLCTACVERAAVDLAPVEAAAVCRGACKAVHESPLADPETLPAPAPELLSLAEKIDG